MNRSKSLLRRALAVAGATAIGLVGAVAIATPASAHHSEVVGVPVCDTANGDWVVTWTVKSFAPDEAPKFRFIEVSHTPADTTLSGIAVTEDNSFPHTTGTEVVGTQKVPGSAESASLTVRAKWSNHFVEETAHTGEVEFDGTCEEDRPKPDFSSVSECNGTVVVTLTNSENARADAEFEVVGEGGFSEEKSVEPGDSAEVTVPAKSAGEITVLANGEPIGKPIKWTKPDKCEAPTLASKSDCDTLTIEVSNPAGGTPTTFTFTPAEGQTKTLDVAPGESKSVVYGGEKAKQVVVSAPGFESETVVWKSPGNCGGEGGSLPQTGMKIGGAVAGALVLLAAGGVLFVVARRRRVTFTA